MSPNQCKGTQFLKGGDWYFNTGTSKKEHFQVHIGNH